MSSMGPVGQEIKRDYLKSLINSGKKISNPTTTEQVAEIKTPAAARSLAFFILSLRSGDTKSDKYSIAVLKHSLVNTIPATIIIAIQSPFEILKYTPEIITIIKITR